MFIEKNNNELSAQIISKPHVVLYRFNMIYNAYMMKNLKWAEDTSLTPTEMYTLMSIEENPGCTVTDLAKYWHVTKGAISQTVTKLDKKGLVQRRKHERNAKNVLLFPTEKGIKISQIEKWKDQRDVANMVMLMLEHYSVQEINAFYSILEWYTIMTEKII